jgi:hypothetical protein
MKDTINREYFHAARWFRPTLKEGYTRLEWHHNHEYHFWDDWECSESVLNDFMANLRKNGFVVEATTTHIRKNSFGVEATTTPTYDRVTIGLWLAVVLTITMGTIHIYYILTR